MKDGKVGGQASGDQSRPDGIVEKLQPVPFTNKGEFKNVNADGDGASDLGQDNRDEAGF